MARTINEIQKEILTVKSNNNALNELSSTSKVAIWRLWVYVIAYAIWVLESLFDVHKKEVDEALLSLKPHSARWYRSKALAFQYGFDLLFDSDKFNNKNKTEEQIKSSKIIKYSAVTESEDESRLIVKIATEKDNKLLPINPGEYDAFKSYIAEIKDAGVKVTVINYLPDRLKLNVTVKRDRLLLNKDGVNMLTAKEPIKEAIIGFLKKLPFNGELSIQALTDEIQKADGVEDVVINSAQAAWIDASKNEYGNYENIYMSKIPVAGYFEVNLNDNDETKSIIKYV